MLTCGDTPHAPALTCFCDRKPGKTHLHEEEEEEGVWVCVFSYLLHTEYQNTQYWEMKTFWLVRRGQGSGRQLDNTLCLKVLTKIDRSTKMYTLTLAHTHVCTRVGFIRPLSRGC